MAGHRFYLPAAAWQADLFTLDAEESHHCAEVVRLKVGDTVSVFDGAGRMAQAVLASTQRRAVTLRPINITAPPARAARIMLAQAIPKGKLMDWIIEKAVELGASDIYPLITDRTVVRLDAAEAAKKQEKWQRIAIEACKQCGQNWLPTVHLPQSIGRFLANRPAVDLPLVAALDPAARKFSELRQGLSNKPQSACILVGPEGDFTPLELQQSLAAEFQPWTFGNIILRAETAAIYGLSVLTHELV
jgi:16S rRNA (uracil1498-N3)-methyltransferase